MEVPGGGRLRLALEDIPPERVKQLNELFEILAELTRKGGDSNLEPGIKEPDQEYQLVRKISG